MPLVDVPVAVNVPCRSGCERGWSADTYKRGTGRGDGIFRGRRADSSIDHVYIGCITRACGAPGSWASIRIAVVAPSKDKSDLIKAAVSSLLPCVRDLRRKDVAQAENGLGLAGFPLVSEIVRDRNGGHYPENCHRVTINSMRVNPL